MSAVASPVDAPALPAAAASAPAVVAPPPGHPRFPLVDSLRALAALAIVAVHAGGLTYTSWDGFVSHAEVGVALFFAISGFLLYRPFVSARLNAAPGTRLRDYFRRRLLRIVPAYWLALTFLAVWPGLPGVFTGHFWVYYGFLQGYSDSWIQNGIPQAWTLCIELSFYLMLPIYAAVMGFGLSRLRRGRQVTVELVVLAVLALLSLGYRAVLREHGSISPVLNVLPTFLDWFAPGMALAVLSAAWQDRALPGPVRRAAARPLIAIALAVIAYAVVSLAVGGPELVKNFGHTALEYTAPQDVARHALYAVVAFALLVPAVITGGGVVRRVLSWSVLAWLGLVSYGIYLWHLSLMVWICQPAGLGCRFHGAPGLHRAPFFAMLALGVLVAVGCAAASYYIVERPILRLKYSRGLIARRSRSRTIARRAKAPTVTQ